MEAIFATVFVIAVGVFVAIGLAIGASAEGPDPGPPAYSPRKVRLTRMTLLVIAALLTMLGAVAATVAGWRDDPAVSRTAALIFLLEGAVDLILALIVLMPAWTLRRIWVLRLVSVCWLSVGAPLLVLTLGGGPPVSFYLGFGPDMWAAYAIVVGAILVWLCSLGKAPAGATEPPTDQPTGPATETGSAAEGSPAESPPPARWRGIAVAVVLASIVALSSWPMAQFAGLLALRECAPQWLVPSDPWFCVSGRLEGQTLTVSGQTSLPDAALVDVQASNEASSTSLTPVTSLRVPVDDGRFQATFQLSNPRPASAVVTAALHLKGQPPTLIALFGSDGHGLSGPAVVEEGWGARSLLVTLTLDLT